MDFCRNVTFSGEYHQQDKVLASPLASCSKLGASLAATANPLDDLFPAQNTEVDVSLEWLSVFVEDCLSSTGNCVLPAPTSNVQDTTTPKPPETFKQKPKQQQEVMLPAAFEKFVIPVKARSKRKRVTSVKARRNPLTNCWSYFPSSDPPLLQQTHWLADSELIMPNKGIIGSEVEERKGDEYKEGEEEEEKALLVSSGKAKDSLGILESNSDNGVQQQQQPRRCTHCLAQRTPQWRAGPLGPKTLCNACGVRYKSGRLLPEYRPAKSPTFVSYLHSNSHKKVLEMRMASSAVFNS